MVQNVLLPPPRLAGASTPGRLSPGGLMPFSKLADGSDATWTLMRWGAPAGASAVRPTARGRLTEAAKPRGKAQWRSPVGSPHSHQPRHQTRQ